MHRVVTTAALVLVVGLAAAGCWSRSVDDGAPAASSGGKASPTRQREVAPATGLTGRVVYSLVQGDLWRSGEIPDLLYAYAIRASSQGLRRLVQHHISPAEAGCGRGAVV
jgi:hypothetical protein